MACCRTGRTFQAYVTRGKGTPCLAEGTRVIARVIGDGFLFNLHKGRIDDGDGETYRFMDGAYMAEDGQKRIRSE
jgi:hypothetical protein